MTAVSSDFSEAGSYSSYPWLKVTHLLPLGEGVAASLERAGMAGGQAYYGHKYKSRYVDIQRLSSAEAGLGRAWHPPLTMI